MDFQALAWKPRVIAMDFQALAWEPRVITMDFQALAWKPQIIAMARFEFDAWKIDINFWLHNGKIRIVGHGLPDSENYVRQSFIKSKFKSMRKRC